MDPNSMPRPFTPAHSEQPARPQVELPEPKRYRPQVVKDGNCRHGFGVRMVTSEKASDSDWRGEDSRQWVEFADYAALATRLAESEARAEGGARDAARWRAMREIMVAIDFDPEMGDGPVVMFTCHAERICAGPEGADAVADAAIQAQEAERG